MTSHPFFPCICHCSVYIILLFVLIVGYTLNSGILIETFVEELLTEILEHQTIGLNNVQFSPSAVGFKSFGLS